MESMTIQNQLFPGADKRSLESKTSIIRSFIKLVEDKGPFRLTFEDVGQNCGKSRSQVRYHFSDLETLLLAAFRYSMHLGRHFTVTRIEIAKTPFEKLDAFVHGAFDWFENDSNQMRIMMLASNMMSADSAIRSEYLETKNIGLRRASSIITEVSDYYELNSTKEFRDKIACGVQKLLMGTMIDLYQRKETFDLPTVRDETVISARKIVHQLFFHHS